MGSANVELVRSIFAAWERGDFSSAEWADPEIEVVIADGPDPGSWKGIAAMAEGWRGRLGAFVDYRAAADALGELDDGRVLVLHHRSGRGRASGVDIRRLREGGATVFSIRDGRVTRLVGYLNRDKRAHRPRPRPGGQLSGLVARCGLVGNRYAAAGCCSRGEHHGEGRAATPVLLSEEPEASSGSVTGREHDETIEEGKPDRERGRGFCYSSVPVASSGM